MGRTLAFVFEMQEVVEPLSDVEGYINKIPEQLGVQTRATLVSPDRERIVLPLRDEQVYPTSGANSVDNSTVDELERIVADGWSDRIQAFDICIVEPEAYYQSASIAAKESAA